MYAKKIIIPLAMFILIGSAHMAAAQSEAAPQETAAGGYIGDRPELQDLRGYLSRAAENNNELRAAFQRWRAAVKRSVHADVLPDPKFTFAYYTTPLETRGGPARYKYGLSQTLPFFGKLDLKEQQALREADGLKAQLDELKLKTFYEVKKAYYEYAYLARAIDITRETIALMEYLERIANARFSTGSASHSDVIRPQVELGKLEDRLRSLRDLKRPQAARINALLDRPEGTEVPLPPSIPVMVITEEKESLVAEMKESNPGLRYWDMKEASEESGAELAEHDFYPDFTFGVESTEVDDSRAPTHVTGDGQNPVMVSMSFNLPVWFNDKQAAVDENRAKARAARRSRAGLERKLEADLQLALYKYRDAGRKLELYKNALVPKAEQSLGVIMEAFMTGSGSSLDLVDAEQTLLELQLSYYRALTNQAVRMAEIEMLVGRELPCTFHGSLLKTDPLNEQEGES